MAPQNKMQKKNGSGPFLALWIKITDSRVYEFKDREPFLAAFSQKSARLKAWLEK